MKKSQKSASNTGATNIGLKSLYLINDDYNTFDHVIDCLVAICEHDPVQAEQCALLTHYNGSCEILLGNIDDLDEVREDFALYGLDVDIR